jgi:hypothetical protein
MDTSIPGSAEREARLQQILQQDLGPGENIVWSGQPDPTIVFSPQDLFLVPFSLMWGGFALFWEAGVLGIFSKGVGAVGIGSFFVLWGIPFVVVGQYLIWGRFLYKRWMKRRTLYAVTTKRVVVVAEGRSLRINSLFLSQLLSVSRSRKSNGAGSITFGGGGVMSLLSGSAMYANTGMDFFARSGGLAFYDIRDVDNVYRHIQAQRGNP